MLDVVMLLMLQNGKMFLLYNYLLEDMVSVEGGWCPFADSLLEGGISNESEAALL